MEKMKFWVMTFVAVMTMGVAISCGDDDGGGDSRLIGTWEEEESGRNEDRVFVFQFKSGGIGHFTVRVKSSDKWSTEEDKDFKYFVLWNKRNLIIVYYNEHEKSYTDDVNYTYKITDNVLYVYDIDSHLKFTLHKKK